MGSKMTPRLRWHVVKLAGSEPNYFRGAERCRKLALENSFPSYLLLGHYVKIRLRRRLGVEGAVRCKTCGEVVPVFEQASNQCFDCLAADYDRLRVNIDGEVVGP